MSWLVAAIQMLVVQRIKTEWTKNSRGGRVAMERNFTPEALLLPPITSGAT
jgi:hypothetical protein